MKIVILLTAALLLSHSAQAANVYSCYGDDGSDLSIEVNMKNKTATLNGEDVKTTYSLSGVLESLPPIYVFGDRKECTINFKPSRDEQSGNVSFRCNAAKFPNALELDMPCSLQ